MLGLSIDEMASFCKKKGFVYPHAEIYGGLAGFFDFGPLGSELKNNIKQQWWKIHVHNRDDIVGIDGSIVNNPKIWEASGHVAQFTDVLLICLKCQNRVRADHFIEDTLGKPVDIFKIEELIEFVKENSLACPKCKTPFENATPFNLMFSTHAGPALDTKNLAYLRPETAQLIMTNFKLVYEHARMKLPFGIAQMGKAYRNEIAPRDFLFRCREFEQMEIEYFIDPAKIDNCPYLEPYLDYMINIYSAQMQYEKTEFKKMSMKEALSLGIIKTSWHAYWLAFEHEWFVKLGAKADNFRIRQHVADEKSHYALDTWDLEYQFPFGWKELLGMANRTDFDLKQHTAASGTDLSIFDTESNTRVMPHVVAEPSLGLERAFLVFMFDAYHDDKARGNVVLKLSSRLAPYKAAVFPLLSNKEELTKMAKDIQNELRENYPIFYDKSGSIGRRYARQDEIGTPYCITVDFDSLTKNDVTIRDRDSTKQVRVTIEKLPDTLNSLLNGKLRFESLE